MISMIQQLYESNRLNNHKLYINKAIDISNKSVCIKLHVGAIIVKNNIILSYGYNDIPKGMKTCKETGCVFDNLKIPIAGNVELCPAIHAEHNAILQAIDKKLNIKDSNIYCTHSPCAECIKLIIKYGIKFVYYNTYFPDKLAEKLLKDANIPIKHIS